MNKNVKKTSSSTYFEDENMSQVLESKMKTKKEIVRTNKIYNQVLKDLDIDALESFEDVEMELLEHKAKGKR